MRYINTARSNAGYPRELLDFYVSELLVARSRPASLVYLISPWLSEFDFFLDRRGYLADLLPGQTRIGIEAMLKALLDAQAHLRIAVLCPGVHPDWDEPIRTTVDMVRRLWRTYPEQVEVRLFSDLHTKLLVGQVAALHGSANSTYSATYVNKELLTYAVDPADLRALREEALTTFSSLIRRVPEGPILGV